MIAVLTPPQIIKYYPDDMISALGAVHTPARPAAASPAHRETASSENKQNTGALAAFGADSAPTGPAAASRVQPLSKPASVENEKKPASPEGKPASGEQELSEEEERQIQKLKQTDAKVHAHENAHSGAGGSHAGGPSYEYTTGPDGHRYATSGEVQIDVSPVRDNPEATLRKMDTVIRAALAPADPSSQDLAVARQAQATRAQAQLELSKQRETEREQLSQKKDEAEPQAGEGSSDSAKLQAQAAYDKAQPQSNSQVAQQIFSAIAISA